MPHAIIQEPTGFEVQVTGTLLVEEAVEILDDLDGSDGAPGHDYELVDLSAADPLDFELEDLHLIARRACLSPRRPGVRLALVDPACGSRSSVRRGYSGRTHASTPTCSAPG